MAELRSVGFLSRHSVGSPPRVYLLIVRASYDRRTDTLNVVLKVGVPVVESDEPRPGIILDFDEHGDLVSLEVLDVLSGLAVYQVLRPNACMAQDRAQRALGNRGVIGNGQSAIGWGSIPQNDVTPGLAVYLVSEAVQETHQLPAAQHRQPAHGISTNSSSGPGGAGSPCAERLAT